jgi:hypothetical protein
MSSAAFNECSVVHFVSFIPSVVIAVAREDIFKQEQYATPRVCKVKESAFTVVSFPPHVSENVADCGSDKTRMRHSKSPVVSVVFASPERKDFGNFLNSQCRYKIETNFFGVILLTFHKDP